MPIFSRPTNRRDIVGRICLTVWMAAALALPGCGRPASEPPLVAERESPSGQAATSPPPPVAEQPAFAPPPLADLDRDAKWIDRPVKDALALLREQQAKETVACSVAEALALTNDSAAANAKILSALGRLPDDGQADLEARIDRHVAGDLGSTNPILISSAAEFDILGLTGFGLFSYDRLLEPFANAETVVSWQTSADGLYDKVVLRDDLVWNDGEPITAHDIAFTYQVIMDPRVPVPAEVGSSEVNGVPSPSVSLIVSASVSVTCVCDVAPAGAGVKATVILLKREA